MARPTAPAGAVLVTYQGVGCPQAGARLPLFPTCVTQDKQRKIALKGQPAAIPGRIKAIEQSISRASLPPHQLEELSIFNKTPATC